MDPDAPPSRTELHALGTVALRRPGTEPTTVLVHPKGIALLAYLVLARPRGFQRRSSLLALLWPDQDERHARWAANQALRRLRRELGPEVIRNHGRHEVGVDRRGLWCDALAFEAACDDSAAEVALGLYRGDLLPGLHVSGCGEFDQWLDGERAKLRSLAACMAWKLTERTEAEGDFGTAAAWARRALEYSPHDEAGARRHILLLDRAGDRAGAVHAYEEYARWLREELDVDPAPETRSLLELIRSRTERSVMPPPSTRDRRAPETAEAKQMPASAGASSAKNPSLLRPYGTFLAVGLLVAVLVASWASSSVRRREARVPEATAAIVDAEALALYREGRELLSRMTEPALRQSIYRFNAAIARDSMFAAAHAGLAAAYMHLGRVLGGMDPREALPLARREALRALSIDDGLAEAHTLMGLYEVYFGWDWRQAEVELRRATELDPNDPLALHALAFYLTLAGRYDEVRPLQDRAIALSPFDPLTWAEAGSHAMLSGRYGEAEGFLQRGLELAPSFPLLLLIHGILRAELGDTGSAIEALLQADTASGHQEVVRGRLGWAYALHGDSAAAREILRELKPRAVAPEEPAKTATAIAVVHIGLGERDSAFVWLDVAHERRAPNLVRLLRTPAGQRLAADPRYAALLSRIGLRPGVLGPTAAGR